jgi:uncharacterized protein YjbJ (UPF0337 family)
MDETKGRVKETVGDITDDERLESEGQTDQAKGKAKQAWGDAKDAVERGARRAWRKRLDRDCP